MNPNENAQPAVDRLTSTVSDATRKATHLAQEAARNVKERADETYHRGEAYVKENPLPALLGAFVLGIAVGYLATRREPSLTFRERYVNEPLDSAREAILATLAPVAKKLHSQIDHARSTAGDTADSWLTDVRRFGNHLKFW